MARKKIIDILPPQGKKKTDKKADGSRPGALKAKTAVLETKRENKFQVPAGFKNFKFSPPSLFSKKKIIFIFLFLALFGLYFLSVSFSTATVEIWPKTETMSFEAKLNLDKKIKQFDVSANSAPAEVIEKEKTISQNFSASGSVAKETKAEGVITVYNNYSPSYQVLVATTRFVSSEGKVFRTKEKVMVPGTTSEGGKAKPGEINIRVVADGSGSAYNIEPDTFSIPGFAGTDKYTKFYAKSFQPFTGGASETALQVTAGDINKAEDVLMQQAKAEAEALLKNDLQAENISSAFNFLENGLETEITEKFSSVKPGSEASEFTLRVKAKSKTLLFKKEDIKNFAKNYVLARMPEGKKIYEPSLKIDYSANSVNFDSGTAALALKISADVYFDIDEKAVKNNVSQKSLSEIRTFLSSQPEIGNVLVKMWPFWLAKAPKDPDRINIKVNFDSREKE